MAIFSTNSTPPKDGAPPARRRGEATPPSIVAADLTIVGDLESEGTVRIEGRVRGVVRAGAQIIVAPGAVVEGDLHAREAVIAGEVHGAICASERVELQATAAVTGDITTQRIVVLEGGRVSGAVTMDFPAAPGATETSADLTAA
jgi:cytoskeletal protein CcmA (bactofilin family)